MADAATWSKRIAEWRSSGLTAQEFSESRGYSAAGLYAWSSRLGRAAEAASKTPVRIARVVQLRAAELPPAAGIATSEVPVVVEIGDARVVVGAGVQRSTLELVLDVLHRQSRGGRS
jgi:hypothetical protein